MKWFIALLLIIAAVPAHAVVVAPSGDKSGTTDTANITNRCKLGNIVQLEAGNYYVIAVTNCTNIVGFGNEEPYFYYEGETAKINVYGVGSSRGVIQCPAGSACRFAGFNIIPGPSQAGIVMDGVHGLVLENMSVVDVAAQGGSCIDARALSGNGNQQLNIRGGVFIHCGGYCLDASEGAGLSDSLIIGATFSNCHAPDLIYIQTGYGNIFNGNKIEDGFNVNGMHFSGGHGGDSVLSNNIFDRNNYDIVIDGQGWYGVVTGNQACGTGNSMWDDQGSFYVVASANSSCSPSYYAAPGAKVSGGFYDPNPTYVDQNSQAVFSPFIH